MPAMPLLAAACSSRPCSSPSARPRSSRWPRCAPAPPTSGSPPTPTGRSARWRSPARRACCSAWRCRRWVPSPPCGLLLLLAGAVVAHLRNGDDPRLLAPALLAGLLVAAYLVVLLGARP